VRDLRGARGLRVGGMVEGTEAERESERAGGREGREEREG
jgi:hypothetical protein